MLDLQIHCEEAWTSHNLISQSAPSTGLAGSSEDRNCKREKPNIQGGVMADCKKCGFHTDVPEYGLCEGCAEESSEDDPKPKDQPLITAFWDK